MSSSPQWSYGYELLCEALNHRRMEQVKLLLSKDYTKVNCASESLCDTPLHFAVRNGNVEVVGIILSKHADVHARGRNGRIPLHLAAANGSKEITGLLLSNGSKPDFRDDDGIAPLHVAAERGYIPVIQELLNSGASINLSSTSSLHNGYTALHHASESGHLKVVEFLLAQGADVDAKEKYGATALHFSADKRQALIMQVLLSNRACVNQACTSGWQEGYTALHYIAEHEEDCGYLAELLLKSGANVDPIASNGYTPLHFATQFDRRNVAQVLLEHGANVDARDKDGKTALYYAAEMASILMVDGILRRGPGFDVEYNNKALHAAISRLRGYEDGYEEVIESLLNYGFNVKPEDAADSNLLHSCVGLGYMKILKTLLKYGADSNALIPSKWKKGHTLLHCAASAERLDVAKLLVEYGANVNARDKEGRTPIYFALDRDNFNMIILLLASGSNVKCISEPMHIAVKRRSIGVVKELLKYGADLDTPDENGLTPLFLAISKGNEEIAIFLISKGADILNKHQNKKRTVLHDAAYKGCERIIRLLLGNVDLDSRDEMGMPPLFYAALRGRVTIVNMFLEYGVDINCIDNYGRTALHMASRSGCSEVVEIILEYGADVNATDTGGMSPLNVAIGGINSYLTLPTVDIDERFVQTFSAYDVIIHLYIKHMTVMKSLNLYLSNSNLLILSQMPYSCFHQKCEEEIKKMQIEKIGDTFSFYDILTKDVNDVAMYMRNENIIHVIELGDYKAQFPLYASMLERKYARGEVRSDLLHLCEVKLDSLFKSVFPHLVSQKILNYLNEKDMKNLINVL